MGTETVLPPTTIPTNLQLEVPNIYFHRGLPTHHQAGEPAHRHLRFPTGAGEPTRQRARTLPLAEPRSAQVRKPPTGELQATNGWEIHQLAGTVKMPESVSHQLDSGLGLIQALAPIPHGRHPPMVRFQPPRILGKG